MITSWSAFMRMYSKVSLVWASREMWGPDLEGVEHPLGALFHWVPFVVMSTRIRG